MENLKEIVWGAVGIWAFAEIAKELLRQWENYRDNWYRKNTGELIHTIEELKSQLPKKGKK